ncbi:hypothetical protein [Spiribacter vilamensis]|uniref:Uncharacterized protein n=1 Tax=Spiribacter vilamensis TaxID=531306 RepID=A0A4Q8D0N3_9GAMM|nr:hypothetical protein [Spiribacter vilamensis]RZU98780.1 hypothetical protein EV698_1042 [Spiribacter vilamensis]TVO62199.1 hypothetical protein FPL09_09000 [Spiribacter vilamensis]
MSTKNTDIPNQYRPGWLDSLDGRYGIARELRARFDEVCADLGGADRLSYMQRSLVERALWLEYWLSQQEQALAKGHTFDVSRWIQAANSLQGIYSRLGLDRQKREAPSLTDYLRQREASA